MTPVVEIHKQIAALVLDTYQALPKTGKTQPHEFTVLAGKPIVLKTFAFPRWAMIWLSLFRRSVLLAQEAHRGGCCGSFPILCLSSDVGAYRRLRSAISTE